MNAVLKCRILERYRTQARFAVACGKPENWISRIIMGRQLPTAEEKDLICRKLGIADFDKHPELPPIDTESV